MSVPFSDALNAASQLVQLGHSQGTGLGSPPSGYGADYDALFAANPYRNLTYKQSFWQRLVSALGFRTDFDRWKEDAQVNSAEYDAGIMSLIQQNDFNDPASQASRMREAGLNPDLLGLGDVQEAASPAEDPNGMSQNTPDDMAQFGDSFMGVLGKTIALYKDFKGLSQLDNMIEAGDLENVKLFYSSIDSFIENRFHESDFINRSSYLKAISRVKGDLENELSLDDYEHSSAYRNGISKKDWKRWTEGAGERLDSLMGDMTAFGAFAKAGNARSEATKSFLQPTYLKTDEQYDVMTGITPIISAKYAEFLEAKAKFDAYQENLREGALKNQGITQDIEGERLDYLHENDAGIKSAQADIAQYDADWYKHKLNQTISDMKKQCLDFLKSVSRHNRFASLMLLNWTMDDMVKMGINANASASVGLNLGLGANIANTVSTILK